MALGRTIRRRRNGIGWTLSDVAELVGTSAQHISDIERGNRSPSPDLLIAICDAIELSVRDAFQAWFDDRYPDLPVRVIVKEAA